MPSATILRNSSALRAMPPPRPPSVNAGRTMHGRPTRGRASSACATLLAMALVGVRSPTPAILAANSSRSSAHAIAS